MISNFRVSLLLLGVCLVVNGCTSKEKSSSPSSSETSVANPQVAHGAVVYKTQCIACHNTDPHKAGTLGPDISGSSRELLEARILRGEYPPGYKPKRGTHLMAPLPFLKNDLDAIHAYLNQK